MSEATRLRKSWVWAKLCLMATVALLSELHRCLRHLTDEEFWGSFALVEEARAEFFDGIWLLAITSVVAMLLLA